MSVATELHKNVNCENNIKNDCFENYSYFYLNEKYGQFQEVIGYSELSLYFSFGRRAIKNLNFRLFTTGAFSSRLRVLCLKSEVSPKQA